jgi:PAS domain S-box-containing protein
MARCLSSYSTRVLHYGMSRKLSLSSQTQLFGLIESAMDAIIAVDHTQTIVLFNVAAETMFGLCAQEAIGSPLDRLLPPEYQHNHRLHVQGFAQAGHTLRKMGSNMLLHAMRNNGERFPIEASISKTLVNNQILLTVILRDVTSRIAAQAALDQARQELRQLARASQGAREEEKRRIARELHDELGQSLTALKLDAGWLQAQLPAHDALQSHIAAMLTLIDTTIASTRRISADLRPLMLDDLGLAESIEWICKNISRRSNLKIYVDTSRLEHISDNTVATALYRVVQEATHNAVKHAGASKLVVTVGSTEQQAQVTIADNGKGMLEADQTKRGSFGLIGIRERILTLDGTVNIDSDPRRGTCLTITIPLNRAVDLQ